MAINPMQLISMAKSGNDPKEIAMQIIQQNFPNDPQMKTLLEYGEKGDINSIQNFAQQYLGQQGLDFNQEIGNFMKMIGR